VRQKRYECPRCGVISPDERYLQCRCHLPRLGAVQIQLPPNADWKVVPESVELPSRVISLAINALAASRANLEQELLRKTRIADRQRPIFTFQGYQNGVPLLQANGGEPFAVGRSITNGALEKGQIVNVLTGGGSVHIGGMPRVRVAAIDQSGSRLLVPTPTPTPTPNPNRLVRIVGSVNFNYSHSGTYAEVIFEYAPPPYSGSGGESKTSELITLAPGDEIVTDTRTSSIEDGSLEYGTNGSSTSTSLVIRRADGRIQGIKNQNGTPGFFYLSVVAEEHLPPGSSYSYSYTYSLTGSYTYVYYDPDTGLPL
jgi:hypothetical protein